jgi:hypothetical protein
MLIFQAQHAELTQTLTNAADKQSGWRRETTQYSSDHHPDGPQTERIASCRGEHIWPFTANSVEAVRTTHIDAGV